MPTRARNDDFFMRAALREARNALGQTSPNPAVGAVLVIDQKIVAKGYHRGAGLPHAEIECLRRVKGPIPRSATLYVTLEPCSTTQRTGPCTDAIVEAGVRRLVIGATDPNPRHAGRGMTRLKDAGLDVRAGILGNECAALNESFNKWIQTRRPFVIAKCGMSLDGRLSPVAGETRWITGIAARRHAQQLRAQVDAILIGAKTLREDDPRLTVRGLRGAKQPWRVVLTRSGSLPKQARLFTDRFAARTIIYRNTNLDVVLRELGEKEVTSVLVEGGGEILGQALDQRLVDKVQLYLGGVFTGGPVVAFPGVGAASTGQAPRLDRVRYEQIGQDVCLIGYPIYHSE
ncbi:MAG TPA: bifunctional diaminohydroxyphosphoribosylaminopyrimidine deaminase/5-amino-6-(5-phosphoribosylamino)uracil reductase RibD [Chthoniobacterales bacterium]|nr:bifunctional diaminohydroxyphosphoribosylaminopyrimidine deaminase/5-amino-6-(5-phosphoribosylamino)uracil reductase RibD [Chthoniobacterales bacterium]